MPATGEDNPSFTSLSNPIRMRVIRGWTPTIAKGRVNEVVRHVIGAPLPEGRSVTLPDGVDTAALKAHIFSGAPADTGFMACGNPGMIEDLKEPLAHIGVTSYLVEEFWKG